MRKPHDRSSGTTDRNEMDSVDAFPPGGVDRDTAADDTATDDATLDGAAATADPRAANDVVERELAEQREKYLRLAAEFDNFRKRTQRERAEAGSRAQADMIKLLIEPLDDLERFANVDPASVDVTTVVEGIGMVGKKLMKALGAAGLEIVYPQDQPFDPAVHEAVATEPAASSDDDAMVSQVYQAGYLFNGLLLRPARVVVRQWNG